MTAVPPVRGPGAASRLHPAVDTGDEVGAGAARRTIRRPTHGRGGRTMTGIRRIAVLIGFSLAVIIGASGPASAGFADATGITTRGATGTVAPPATVTVNGYCSQTTSSYWDGYTTVYTTSYWYNATV